MKKDVVRIIRSLFICIVIVSAFMLFLTPEAECLSACKVIYIQGMPKIMKAGSTEWNDCKTGMAMDNGDRVKTMKDEAVELSFSDTRDNVIRVEGDSDVYVTKGEDPYIIKLANGAVMALLNNLPKNSKFEVRTPAGLSGARGTGWRSSTDGVRSTFDAYERSIYVSGIDASGNESGDSLVVDSGFRASVEKFERPGALEKLSDKDMERWNSWKADLAGRQGEGDKAGGSNTTGAATGAGQEDVSVLDKTDRSALDRADVIENRMDRNDAMRDSVNQTRDEERVEDRSKIDNDRRTAANDDGGRNQIINRGQ